MAIRRVWLGLVIVWLAGCKLFDSTCKPDDRTCLQGGLLRSGQPCIRTGDCAAGLSCKAGECSYAGTTGHGAACVATAECKKGFYCSKDLQCTEINDDPQMEGGLCSSTADCEQGLVCDVDLAELFQKGPYGLIPEECHDALDSSSTPENCKLPRQCTARGKTELGVACKTNGDCLAGLFCAPNPIDTSGDDICVGDIVLTAEPVSTPRWDGVSCPSDDKDPIAYFEVPRDGHSANDFYRLPFPNDIRRTDSGIDLSGHPSPPPDLDPPAAARFIDVAGQVDGFATNPLVYFRFSQAIDTSGLSPQSVRIVDITRGSPEYGKAEGIWGPPERESHYICPHWLALYRKIGSPLRPNTTYAALVTSAIHAEGGATFERSPDFEAMLKADRPGDPDLGLAWDKYKPLREFLNDPNLDPPEPQVLNAAVFTTQDPIALLPKLRAAVEADGPPVLSDLTRCNAQTKSPCEDATGRGACHAANDDFIEIHGHVALAAYQRGTPPYEEPANGGDIALDGAGDPQQQDHTKVCFALSIPTTPAPAGGYPLLIVGHGTGGSFSDPMGSSGVSRWAAHISTPAAVLAIDLPSHGSRRGASPRPPEDLFFNFLNPAAARGNAIQGAVDLISLTLLAQPGIPMPSPALSQAIRFDPSKVVVYGHSQGATHASLMLPFESRVRAGLLSGIGGHLASSLRLKAKPVDIGKVLPFAMFDADSEGKLVAGEANPLLALIQGYFEQADPINYARLMYREPPASAKDGHDIFMTYGLFDGFSPERTQQAFADAANFVAVERDATTHFPTLPPPLHENVTVGERDRTVGLRTYDPLDDPLEGQPPQDGHFVAFATKRGVADVRRFLEQALRGDTPQVGE